MSTIFFSAKNHIGFVAVCLLAFFIATMSWMLQSFDRAMSAQGPVVGLLVRQGLLTSVQQEILNAETGQRGYLLTQKREYLKPYYEALESLDVVMNKLTEEASADPVFATDVVTLTRIVNEKLVELEKTVALTDAAKSEQAIQLMQTGAGMAKMQEIRAFTRKALMTQERALKLDLANQAHAVDQAQRAFIVSGVINVLLLCLIIVLGRRFRSQVLQTQRSLETKNQGLALALDETARNSQLIRQLSELSQFLQSAASLEEAIAIMQTSLPPLLESDRGALYMSAESKNHLHLACAWGYDDFPVFFEPQACWALRRGQPYSQPDKKSAKSCAHLHDIPILASSMCVPLAAQGEVIGMIYFSNNPSRQITSENRQFEQAALEQVALAISNIRLRESLRHQSIKDLLTGLYNRRFLEEVLSLEFAKASRNANQSETPHLAVLMMDIDHFKVFNDQFGHDAGDEVLIRVAQVLQAGIRESDTVARYGGEEFAAVLPVQSQREAEQIAERIRAAVAALTINHNDASLGRITISVGIALLDESMRKPAELLKAGDDALYMAKRRGRDCVVVHCAEQA